MPELRVAITNNQTTSVACQRAGQLAAECHHAFFWVASSHCLRSHCPDQHVGRRTLFLVTCSRAMILQSAPCDHQAASCRRKACVPRRGRVPRPDCSPSSPRLDASKGRSKTDAYHRCSDSGRVLCKEATFAVGRRRWTLSSLSTSLRAQRWYNGGTLRRSCVQPVHRSVCALLHSHRLSCKALDLQTMTHASPHLHLPKDRAQVCSAHPAPQPCTKHMQ